MHRYRAPSIAPGTFFVAQSWADFIINMSESNLRQAQSVKSACPYLTSLPNGSSLLSLTQLGHEPSICAVHYWIMNSRNGHLTGLVVDAYLSRKIQSLGLLAAQTPSCRCQLSPVSTRDGEGLAVIKSHTIAMLIISVLILIVPVSLQAQSARDPGPRRRGWLYSAAAQLRPRAATWERDIPNSNARVRRGTDRADSRPGYSGQPSEEER